MWRVPALCTLCLKILHSHRLCVFHQIRQSPGQLHSFLPSDERKSKSKMYTLLGHRHKRACRHSTKDFSPTCCDVMGLSTHCSSSPDPCLYPQNWTSFSVCSSSSTTQWTTNCFWSVPWPMWKSVCLCMSTNLTSGEAAHERPGQTFIGAGAGLVSCVSRLVSLSLETGEKQDVQTLSL